MKQLNESKRVLLLADYVLPGDYAHFIEQFELGYTKFLEYFIQFYRSKHYAELQRILTCKQTRNTPSLLAFLEEKAACFKELRMNPEAMRRSVFASLDENQREFFGKFKADTLSSLLDVASLWDKRAVVQASEKFRFEDELSRIPIDDDLVTINEQPLNSTSVNLLDLPDLENEGSVLVQNGKLSSLFFCLTFFFCFSFLF